MKARFSFLLIVLLLSVGRGAAQETVVIENGRVSFALPQGFRAMSSEQIALKYPSANRPQHAYANDRGSVSIAVTFSETALTLEQLPEFQAAMEQLLPRLIPGLRWVRREIVEINGRPWVHFELTSFAVDTDIRNHMYMTALDGRMLGFNLNSAEGEYPAVRDALAASRDSLRIVE